VATLIERDNALEPQTEPQTDGSDRFSEWPEFVDPRFEDQSARRSGPATLPTRGKRTVIEAEEIVFRVGQAMLALTRENGGTLEIRAPNVRIAGENIVSMAGGTMSVLGKSVVVEAGENADVMGKLVRIDGQCVKINC
jgi:hypothetical protein